MPKDLGELQDWHVSKPNGTFGFETDLASNASPKETSHYGGKFVRCVFCFLRYLFLWDIIYFLYKSIIVLKSRSEETVL